jgi:RHS repeat-associated protein
MVDPDGNATGGTPSQHTWTTAYDPLDRLTSATDPLSHSTSSTYDGAGHRASSTDRNGNVTSYTYDAAGRLATVAQKPDPSGQPTLTYTTSVGRDDDGNATSMTQANGVVTNYAYDALNRLMSMTTHPASGTNLVTSYTLDRNGNTITRTSADSVVTTYTYDNLSRLTQIAATGLTSISYAYDELSRRTSMGDGTGNTTYSYDRMGRLTQASQPNGTVSYAYDLDSNRTTLTYPGSNAVTYSFSSAGRLSSLQDWGSRTTSYTYTPAGLAATVTLPNGLVTTYTFDRAQRLTNLTNIVGSTTITSHAYTLDSEGNRTAQTEFVSGITTGTSDSFGYTYDGLSRLTAVTTTNAEAFTLDSASNIASRTGPSATYSYDASNRLTGDGSQTFTWSNADRLTGRGSDSFGYDPLGRLTSSSVGGVSRTFAYSGDGLLQTRTQGGTSNAVLWDPSASPSTILGLGADRIVHGLGPLYTVRADGTTITFARDGLGSVRAELNASGGLTASFRYRVYGAIAQSNGGSSPIMLGYAGELLDQNGLIYLRARWYDPNTGRFVAAEALGGDPGSPVSLNACSYAYARPSMLVDPFGLDPDPKRCRSLARRIANTIAELAKRKAELEQDPKDFVLSNREELENHERLFAKRQEDLLNRVNDWENEGCDNSGGPGSALPADAWDWILAPKPSRTRPVGAGDGGAPNLALGVGTVAFGAGVGYGLYRVVRFLPSLLPPLWETIPFNLAIP